MSDAIYTVKEAAGILRVGTHYIYKLINLGMLPYIKLGSIKIRESAINDFLNQYDCMDVDKIMEDYNGK